MKNNINNSIHLGSTINFIGMFFLNVFPYVNKNLTFPLHAS